MTALALIAAMLLGSPPPAEYLTGSLVIETPVWPGDKVVTATNTAVTARTCAAAGVGVITQTPASTGDLCMAAPDYEMGVGLDLSMGCYVSATNTITTRYCNPSAAARTPADAGFEGNTSVNSFHGTTVPAYYSGGQLQQNYTGDVNFDAAVVSATTSAFSGTSITANTCSCPGTVTVTGAAVGNGDPCLVGPPSGGMGTGLGAFCYISAANTVTACFCDYSTSNQTVSTGTWTYGVATTSASTLAYSGNALTSSAGTPTVLTTTTTFSGTSAASACTAQTAIVLTGAAVGNICVVGPPSGGFGTNLITYCFVGTSGHVTPVFCNASASAQTKGSGTWTFGVLQ